MALKTYTEQLSPTALVAQATYKWTLSGSGTSEYYVELLAGGDPSIAKPDRLTIDKTTRTEGTVGSLSAGEWDHGDNDTLGYSTVYVRLDDGVDPDLKEYGFVHAAYDTTTTYQSSQEAETGFIEQTLALADFTDNTDATGYVDMSDQVPANVRVLGWSADVTAGFTGDTTAVVQVGVAGTLDKYSGDTTASVLAAAIVGSGPQGDKQDVTAAATTIRVTVTGGADFTSISAGSMILRLWWIQ